MLDEGEMERRRVCNGLNMIAGRELPHVHHPIEIAEVMSEDGRSLGTYMILDHVLAARAHGLPYVYLGYWVRGSEKMDYKIRFTPLEALTQNGWEALEP